MKRMEEKWSRDVTCKFLKQEKVLFNFYLLKSAASVCLFFLNESSLDEPVWRFVQAHVLPL